MSIQENNLKHRAQKEEMKTYQKNWKGRVERMQDGRFPKLALKCQPVGKRSRGRPKKDGKISSSKRVEEYRINKPSQQFRKKNNNLHFISITYSCNQDWKLCRILFGVHRHSKSVIHVTSRASLLYLCDLRSFLLHSVVRSLLKCGVRLLAQPYVPTMFFIPNVAQNVFQQWGFDLHFLWRMTPLFTTITAGNLGCLPRGKTRPTDGHGRMDWRVVLMFLDHLTAWRTSNNSE
jgi:hypothetical protein